MSPSSQTARPLTKSEAAELCRLAHVPADRRARFIDAVEKSVASYLRSRKQKTPQRVEGELKDVEKRVKSCLGLRDHNTWRPGEFHKGLEEISCALRRLSPRAHEFLQFRNVKVVYAIPEGWKPGTVSDLVVDPICFSDVDDQVYALEELFGALAGPVAKRRDRGHPQKDAERALLHFIALAFRRDTGKAGSETSPAFMATCEEIKRLYKLDDWKPGSLPRSARRLRAQED
jgi:hypothetical protein